MQPQTPMNSESLANALGIPASRLVKYSSKHLVRVPGGYIPRVALINNLRNRGISEWRPLSDFDEVSLVDASRTGTLQEITAMTDTGTPVSVYRIGAKDPQIETAPEQAPETPASVKMKEKSPKRDTVVFAPGDNLLDPTDEDLNTINWGAPIPRSLPSNGKYSTHVNGMPVAKMSEKDLRRFGFRPQRDFDQQKSMTSGFQTGVLQRVRFNDIFWYRISPKGYQRRGYYTEEFLAQHGYTTRGLDRTDTHFGTPLWLCLELQDHLRYTHARQPRGKAAGSTRPAQPIRDAKKPRGLRMKGAQGAIKPQSIGFRRIDALMRKGMVSVEDIVSALAFYRGTPNDA